MEANEMEPCVVEADKCLKDLQGSLVQNIMHELSKNGAWQQVARRLESHACHEDINNERKLLDHLMEKYSLTVKGLQIILKACQLYDVLRIINTNEPARFLYPEKDTTRVEPLDHRVELYVDICGSPFPQIQWYFEGSPLIGKTSLVLLLEKFSIKDIGEYTCKIKRRPSDAWKPSHQYILTMEDAPPRISESEDLKDVDVKANEDMILSFKVRGYPEPKSFRWFRDENNKLISETKLPQLIIRGVDVHKSGKYYCIAVSTAGWCRTKTAVVKVEELMISPEKPEIIEQPKANQVYFAGDWLYLVCEVRCSEKVNFTCFRNNKELIGNSNARVTSLSSKDRHQCEVMYRLTQEEMDMENWKQLHFKFAVSSTKCNGLVLSDDVIVEVKTRDIKKTPTARNKWALVIGNSIYQEMGELPGTRNDIHILKNNFNKLGFRVLMLSDLKRTAIQNAVRLFSTFIKKGDYVSFFYAGHGIHSDGKDYIIPVDVTLIFESRMQNLPLEERDISLDECLSCVWIINVLQEHEPALIFSIYDTCRMMKPRFQGSQPHSSRDTFHIAAKNSVFLFATSENCEAYEDKNISLLVDTLQKLMTYKISVQDLAIKVLQEFDFPEEGYERQVPKISCDLALPLSLADPSQPQEIDVSDSGVLKDWERLASGRGRVEHCISVANTKVEASIYWDIEPRKDGVTWVIRNCLTLSVNLSQDASSEIQEMDVQIKLSTGKECFQKLKGSLSVQFPIPHLQDLEDRMQVELCFIYKGNPFKETMHLESPAISQRFFRGNYI